MEHHHYTDIAHTHNYQSYNFGFNPPSTGSYFANYVTTGYAQDGQVRVTEGVNGATARYSGGSISNDQSAPRTQTDSNNSIAVETRPTNFTVKIWKRTA